MYWTGATQMPLTLGGHFSEDMALVGALALETGPGFLEPFGRAAMGF